MGQYLPRNKTWFLIFGSPIIFSIRILQDVAGGGFTPCRVGRVEDKIILFKSGQWAEGGVNVGLAQRKDVLIRSQRLVLPGAARKAVG
jgi:hypothetical protein